MNESPIPNEAIAGPARIRARMWNFGYGLAMAAIVAVQVSVLLLFVVPGMDDWQEAAFLVCALAPAAYAGWLVWRTFAQATETPSSIPGGSPLGLALAFVIAAAVWELIMTVMYGIAGQGFGFAPLAVALVILPAILFVGIASRFVRETFAPR